MVPRLGTGEDPGNETTALTARGNSAHIVSIDTLAL